MFTAVAFHAHFAAQYPKRRLCCIISGMTVSKASDSETSPAAAVRPLNSRFDCHKIESFLSEPIAPWQRPLEHFLRQL